MKKTEIRESWQVMAFLQKAKGADLIADILDVSVTQVRRYSRNPKMRYADPSCPNPFDWVMELTDEIHDLGRDDVLMATINLMASRYGLYVTKDNIQTTPDKPTLELELFDDYPPISDLHQILLDPNSTIPEARQALQTSKRELDESYLMFLEKRGRERNAK